MQCMKMLGLAAAALMAFVGASSASATVLCKTAETTGCVASGWDYPAGSVIEATSTGIGVITTTGGTVLDECEDSTLVGKTSNTGSSSETVKGPITTLDWGTCTKDTTTINNGELEIHWIAGTDNGTLTTIGTEVTVNTIFGSCIFSLTHIGTLVGGNGASVPIVKQPIKKVSGNFACPSEALWSDTLDVKTPKPLYVSTN